MQLKSANYEFSVMHSQAKSFDKYVMKADILLILVDIQHEIDVTCMNFTPKFVFISSAIFAEILVRST